MYNIEERCAELKALAGEIEEAGKCPQQIFPIPEPMLYVGVVVKKLHLNKEALEILRRRYESKMEN